MNQKGFSSLFIILAVFALLIIALIYIVYCIIARMSKEVPNYIRIVKGKRSDRYVVNDKRGEMVDVNNRGTFDQVNRRLGGLLAAALRFYHYSDQHDLVRVTDLGGGSESLCARTIADRYPRKAIVVNIDYLAEAGSTQLNIWQKLRGVNPVQIINQDACAPEEYLQGDSQQLVYSHYLLPNLDRREGDITRHIQMLRGVATVLAPNGIGLIHIKLEKMAEIQRSLDLSDIAGYTENYTGEFLILTKGECPIPIPTWLNTLVFQASVFE